MNRVYCELKLNLRIKPSKRLVREKPQTLAVPRAIDEIWSMNVMQSSSEDGHNFRLFNVIDDLNKEGLAIDVDLSLPAARVIRFLTKLLNGAVNRSKFAVTMA